MDTNKCCTAFPKVIKHYLLDPHSACMHTHTIYKATKLKRFYISFTNREKGAISGFID